MQIQAKSLDLLIPFFPLFLVVTGVSAVLLGAYWLLIGRQHDLDSEHKFPRQLILLALTLVGLVFVVLVLPISEGSRNQLMGLIGLLFSGIIAFSSTSAVANIVAGIMLRITKSFRIGDYLRLTTILAGFLSGVCLQRKYNQKIANLSLFPTDTCSTIQ